MVAIQANKWPKPFGSSLTHGNLTRPNSPEVLTISKTTEILAAKLAHWSCYNALYFVTTIKVSGWY
jgi:hypothetical protein